MFDCGSRWTRRGAIRGHRVLVLAGALLLACGLAQAHAQGMGEPKGKVKEVTGGDVEQADVVLVRILKQGNVEHRAGKGHSEESGTYTPDKKAVEFTKACRNEAQCKKEFGDQDYIEVTGRVSKEALGASEDEPITAVIPGFMIKVGNSTCWWSCSRPGGSGECECVCVGGGSCPRL